MRGAIVDDELADRIMIITLANKSGNPLARTDDANDPETFLPCFGVDGS